MALQDILDAIKKAADTEIETVQSSAKRAKEEMSQQADRDIASYEHDAQQQLAQKKESLQHKAETMVHIERRSALLQEKRSLLDAVYEEVLTKASQLSDDEVKELLNALMSLIKDKKGEVRPAKPHASLIPTLSNFNKQNHSLGDSIDARGGFIFMSETTEEDCTFERLIEEQLRPETEVATASTLFNS